MFSKYQGLGNDFVIVDQRKNSLALTKFDLSKCIEICDRRKGIGADGVIVLLEGTNGCQYTMRIINADGSEAEMCGNGIRCLALFIREIESGHDVAPPCDLKYLISTMAGKIITEIMPDGSVTVDMGQPILFPYSAALAAAAAASNTVHDLQIPYSLAPFPLQLSHGCTHLVTDISMGNPHAVVFVNNLVDFVQSGAFKEEGPLLSSHHDVFPDGTNAEFVQVISRNHLHLEVWERGSGHTQACGTGACASTVAAVLAGHVVPNEWCRVTLPGGDLLINWKAAAAAAAVDVAVGQECEPQQCGHVFMRGPAVKIFTGESSMIGALFS